MFGWRRKSTTIQTEVESDGHNSNAENAHAQTPFDEVLVNVISPPSNSSDEFEYVIGSCSDVGCVRQLNEDNARCISLDQVEAQPGVLLVVADGMGGHAGGEVASLIAVETIGREYSRPDGSAQGQTTIALRESLERANAAIFQESKRDKAKRGMGTTCTALILSGEKAWYAHAGDSRLYLIRGEEIYQLSQDHSAVMDMVRQGLLIIEQARNHENKNLITRALGLHPSVEIETWDEPFPVRADDRFLLSSDGLHDLIEDAKIKALVLESEPQIAAEKLVEAARANGGYDNITVIIAHVCEKIEVGEIARDAPVEDETPITRDVHVESAKAEI